MKPGVLTIYMENPEIPVGKSNGTHCSIWGTSEKSYGLLVKVMQFYCSFWDLQLMFIHFACYPSSVKKKLNHFALILKISIRVVCVNGKHPWLPRLPCPKNFCLNCNFSFQFDR